MMTINFTIDKEDQLIAQLFVVSKSDRIRKKRRKNRLIAPLILLIFAILSLISKDYFFPIYLFIVSVAYYFLYPIWERKYYIKHYKGFIDDKFIDRKHIQVSLEMNKEYLKTKDDFSEAKVKCAMIKEFCEIKQFIFIILADGQTFFLPKDKLENVEEIRTQFMDLAKYLQINYTIDENWKWK